MPTDNSVRGGSQARLRSQLWFDNPDNPGMTALYLERYLAYLGLVEVLYGYPLDGAVLMTGCDKTAPACLMAAATVNTPAIVLSGGPMLNHVQDGKLMGSGTLIWQARQDQAVGKIGYKEFIDIVAASAPS